jgi:hypothetical protein
VYWSQQLFLIPYKWDSGSTATGASSVKLYLSQDRGQTWNEISDAKPEVQFFNYHAPSDGEYWFSMRTIDSAGRAWPDGPHQAELRVIVDTQNPTVTSFDAQLRADGAVTAVWQASDANIDSRQSQLQFRTPTDDTWRDVPSGSLRTPAACFLQGEASWQVPEGTPSVWVRLTVRDLAGNGREAGAEARVDAAPSAQLASSSYRLPPPPPISKGAAPGTSSSADDEIATRRVPSRVYPTAQGSMGWSSARTSENNQMSAPPDHAYASNAAVPQAWPSDGESPLPLGSPRTTPANQVAAPPLGAYASQRQPRGSTGWANSTPDESHWANTPAARQGQSLRSPFQLPSATSNLPSLQSASARPFGNTTRPTDREIEAGSWNHLPSLPSASNQPPMASAVASRRGAGFPTNPPLQHLNSLDFEIGYDVDTAGTFGVTRVELWGTADAGQSWQRLAVDTDNRSPILAAVPAPGDYGLVIVVETAGGIDPVRPRPGDLPEMRVRIDTTPPVAKLTGISQGAGANADHLMVQWQGGASFGNEESVSLAYSSHPSGPWVNAAANLPNSGHYAWRLARHLPRSFYVRLEVRDIAGNLSTDQTQVPVEITLPTPSGRLGSARPVQ